MSYRTYVEQKLAALDGEFDEAPLFRHGAVHRSETLADAAAAYRPMDLTTNNLLPSAATLTGLVLPTLDQPAVEKGFESFQVDGVGDLKPVLPTTPLLVTTDIHPADATTTATLTVDGDHIVASIDSIGDQDWFRVELEAGQTYDISMFQVIGGPSLVPLADAYIELYDAAGQLITSADGGGPNTPEGLDAVLTFTAQTSGTYYVNAMAFDQVAQNGTTGDGVGDYEVFVESVDAADPTAYVPFYSPDSPLHAIDWGTQFTRTTRNPDGDSGTRSDNGVPTGQTPVDNNIYGIEGKNVITYYFAEQGEVFIDENPTTPGSTDTMVARGMVQWEKDAFVNAFHVYESVADIVYVEVHSREEADIKIITYNGTPGVGASLLGRMSPPGTENAGQAEFNAGDVRWTEEGLQPGGFYFPTLLHELGHGHGLAHPHDNGGHSSVMRGSDDGSVIGGATGDFGLSDQVYTIMSYNDGWTNSPYGQARSGGITGTEVDPFGWVGTLSPLDIAVLQDKYGVNEDTATGNDIYVLKDVNDVGTMYSSIWDAGGADEIRYSGARDANIDLRAATLQYEEGGGGRVSYATGIYGGFTIANGVVIENARGGSGNDTVQGNDANNALYGNAGADTLQGFGGDDFLDGGLGDDTLFGGDGQDMLKGQAGDDQLHGGAGEDRMFGLDGDDYLYGGDDDDQILGGAGDDVISGDAGDDIIAGGLGKDTLSGGEGKDLFSWSLTSESAVGAADRILDFDAAAGDRLNLRPIDADVNTEGDQAFTFVSAFTGHAAEAVRSYDAGEDLTTLSFDTNGDGLADMVIELNGDVTGGWLL